MPIKKIEFVIRKFDDISTAYHLHAGHGMRLELRIINAILASSLSNADKAEMVLMGGHQHRLQTAKAYQSRRLMISKIETAALWTCNYAGKTFEDLYQDVEHTIAGCKYAGQMTKYDIAKRIGTVVGLQPTNYVYLHGGTLEGARRLLGNRSMKEGCYDVANFKPYFPTLKAMEIEDVLCIFHDAFGAATPAQINASKGNIVPPGIAIRYWFDNPNAIIACHAFRPQDAVKRRVNAVLKKANLPTLK